MKKFKLNYRVAKTIYIFNELSQLLVTQISILLSRLIPKIIMNNSKILNNISIPFLLLFRISILRFLLMKMNYNQNAKQQNYLKIQQHKMYYTNDRLEPCPETCSKQHMSNWWLM